MKHIIQYAIPVAEMVAEQREQDALATMTPIDRELYMASQRVQAVIEAGTHRAMDSVKVGFTFNRRSFAQSRRQWENMKDVRCAMVAVNAYLDHYDALSPLSA